MRSIGVNNRQSLGADINVKTLLDLARDAFDSLICRV